MLTAIKDNKTIFVFQHDPSSLREWSDKKQLSCPDCYDDVIFKYCGGKQSHFAHVSRNCAFPYREPESIEHEKGKLSIYHWLHGFFGSSCAIEHHIRQTNQRSDLFLLDKKTAIEFQCTPLQTSTWEKRHALYEAAGVRDFWILGYSMHKLLKKENPLIHRLNQLERTLLDSYGALYYYDVLTDQFIIIEPSFKQRNYMYGIEYFFPPKECQFDTSNSRLTTKYDYFRKIQTTRKQNVHRSLEESQKTESYLKQIKTKSPQGKQMLASKKQLLLIETLLTQKKMTIPYKMHGLLRHEASSIIQDLLKKEPPKKKLP